MNWIYLLYFKHKMWKNYLIIKFIKNKKAKIMYRLMHINIHLKESDFNIDKINLDTASLIWKYKFSKYIICIIYLVLTSSSACLWASSFLQNFALGPALGKSVTKSFASKQISAS